MKLSFPVVPAVLWVAAQVGLAAPAAAQFGQQGGKVDATLYTRPEGDLVRAAVELRIERGFHLYHTELGHPKAIGKPLRVEWIGADVDWSPMRFPEPHEYDQSDLVGEEAWILGHEGTIVAYALGRVARGAALGDLELELKGLTCEDSGSCVPYEDLVASSGSGPDAVFARFPSDLEAPSGDGDRGDDAGTADGEGSARDGGAAAASTAAAAGAVNYAQVEFPPFDPQGNDADHGLLTWMLLAFVAGLILNVMPCVLPVISIKVLSFVQQAGEDRRRIFRLGLAFALGIFVVFMALAALAVGLGLSWGEQFQSEAFLVTMIGIVFALSLSLFGVYELGVPSGVGAIGGLGREGLGDAFFKGMLATVLATPCSGPFLGSTLTWTLSQPPHVVLLVFAMLGLGMALPYVVLTANPALLKLVPRPGPWMDVFKQAMGFLLLATVVYLMVSLRQDNLLFTAGFLVFVALGCWWWGSFAKLDQKPPVRVAHLAVALGLVGLGARLSFVDFKGLFAAPEGVAWVEFDAARFDRLLEEGRTVFVDFTADWCPNCKWNEAVVYESGTVRALLEQKGVVSMKADITDDSPRTDMIERLLRALGGRSIPYMAIFPGDRPYEPFVRPDVLTVAQMVDMLEACPDPARPSALPAPPPAGSAD